jgi:hypothetical protein
MAGGSSYIAVPAGVTPPDRLYPWLGGGVGHVNAFHSSTEVIGLVERHTGMRFTTGRALMTSLSVLNRKSLLTRPQRKMALLGGGREGLLLWWSVVSRLSDRWFRTRLSLYGWALYFGALHEEVDSRPWSNVCVRCGSGSASVWLEASGLVKRDRWRIRGYVCRQCGAWNVFTRDTGFDHLQ